MILQKKMLSQTATIDFENYAYIYKFNTAQKRITLKYSFLQEKN